MRLRSIRYGINCFALACLLLLICATACAGPSNPNTPDIQIPDSDFSSETQLSRNLLWYGIIEFDPLKGISIIPARGPATHFNVRSFLEEGPCSDCLRIRNIELMPDDVLGFDIQMIHPFPGLDRLTGFDVRGIVLFNGSEEWPGHGLTVPESMLGDGELLNADGYTRLYNPVEFPPDSLGMPLWEYSRGRMAPDVSLSATLNGYKAFNKDMTRRHFPTTDTSSAYYIIKKPDGPFLFGYAVDCGWKSPDPSLTGDPEIVDVPEDFEIDANCPEAYRLSVSATDGLLEDGSGAATIFADVYDWQHDELSASGQVECPDLFDGLMPLSVDIPGPDYTRFRADVADTLPVSAGQYEFLVSVEDVTNDSGPLPFVAYEFGTIEVDEAPEEIAEPELIIELDDIFHSPYCAKVDTFFNACYVDCTQAAPVLDFGFYRIDKEENVTKEFEKVGSMFQGMPGLFGLNVEGRKLIAPDILGAWPGTCPVDVWDIDTKEELKFYVPIDEEDEVAFCMDGELYFDLQTAVVCDGGPANRLVYWDFTEPSPEMHEVETNGFPSMIEPDYPGHRLFVFCSGGGGETPSVQVWNVATWEKITEFDTLNPEPPFMSDIDYDPAMSRIYFGCGADSLEIWDSETFAFIEEIHTGYGEVAGVDHMGRGIYVTTTDGTTGHLLVYDATTFELQWDVTCGEDPRIVACNPNNAKIYVPDMEGQSVFVFQG